MRTILTIQSTEDLKSEYKPGSDVEERGLHRGEGGGSNSLNCKSLSVKDLEILVWVT